VPVAREAAAQLGVQSVTSRVIETPIARLVQAIPACVFDVPLACGVAALIAALRGMRRWGMPEAVGFTIAFLAPPIVLDSAFWNQTDSWVTTWMVWSIWALVSGRLSLAGIFWAAALLTKPQGILLAPVFAYAFLAYRFESGGSWSRSLAIWRTGIALIATAALVTLPFTLTDRNHAAGPIRWFQRSYVDTIGSGAYQRTTLNAFNVWWLHWMASGATREALDSTGTTLGVRRNLLGKTLLAATLLAAGALSARRWAWRAESIVAFAGITCLAAFVFPTAVHERYIYYCIPFLIVMAVSVGAFELTSFRWLSVAELHPGSLAATLAVAVCMALAFLLVSLIRKPHGGADPILRSSAPRTPVGVP
jgi:Gpi18-like mannosyltransferase